VFAAALVAGVALGATYALLATTLILLVRTTGILNFAVAQMATLVSFIGFELDRAGIGAVATVLLTMLISGVMGPLVYLLVIRPARTTAVYLSLRTLGLLLVLDAVVKQVWGAGAPYRFPRLLPSGQVQLFGTAVTYTQIGTAVAAAVVALAVGGLLRSPRLGLLLRAVAADRPAAARIGIDVRTADILAWGIVGVVCAASGLLYAQQATLAPGMLDGVLVAAFAAAQVADMRSLPVGLGAGLALGIVESLSSVYFNNPVITQVISFGILVVGLLWRQSFAAAGRAVST